MKHPLLSFLLSLLFTTSLSQLTVAQTLTKTSSVRLATGDIIFTTGPGTQAEAVKAATGSPWTHTALIFLHNGQPMVLEAVQPIRAISLKSYLARGGKTRQHEFKRLKDRSKITTAAIEKSQQWISKHIGKDYDGRFQWSDNHLYCSELVWKLYKTATGIELCKIKQVKDYNIQHPKVSQLIKARYGSVTKLNLNEKIVAPSDLYQSDLLMKITPKGTTPF